jgi:glycerol uptake facilitator-like aquaporin
VHTSTRWSPGRTGFWGSAPAPASPLDTRPLTCLLRSPAASAGALLANLMFDRRVLELSTKDRITTGHLLGEVVATAGLIALIFALARTGRAGLSAAAVGAYIGAAYWFTNSTSFANPAVTLGRIFSDTFAGIAPRSAPGLIAAQIIGAAVGLGLVVALFPDATRTADEVVVPHDQRKTPVDQRSSP